VLSFGIPRAAAITDHGMTLTTPQGVAEAINFQEAGVGKVATTGDFVLTAEEVNPVISALEEHDIAVTALHSHMLTEQPRLFFMHFWAVGSTESWPPASKRIEPCCCEAMKSRVEVRDAKDYSVFDDCLPSGFCNNGSRPDSDFEESHSV
jgi:hypothetical protein